MTHHYDRQDKLIMISATIATALGAAAITIASYIAITAPTCTELGGTIIKDKPHYHMVGRIPMRHTPTHCQKP